MKDSSSDIRFFLDYISSNAYLAWHEIHSLAEPYGRRVDPVPVLFAGLLNAHGQLGPAEVPPKALWMNRNIHRKAELPLGKLISRKVVVSRYTEAYPGAPGRRYVVLQYQAVYERKESAIETLMPLYDDGEWRVSGYFIR